jgi:magnesium and cobalt transporter
MNDKPPSTGGTGSTGVLKRVVRAIKGDPWSREEIHDLLQQSETAFDPEEQDMLQGVLEVAETQVREVMIPRSQMVVIERSQKLDEMLQVIVESGHSRFPVIGEDRDEVLGVLLAKDLLRYFGNEQRGELRIEDYLRPPAVIPESKRLKALLKEFRDSHNHMAIVVDEYGGVSGLLTIEDVLEEIVGEIVDEYDKEVDEDIQRLDDNTFEAAGRTHVDEINDAMKIDLPDDGDFDTIAGFVFTELGRVPLPGEMLDWENKVRILVLEVSKRRIERVRIQRLDNGQLESA